MITYFEISNFKAHSDTKVQLGNLTLLCGGNGVGKSSFIQALLVLRQSYLKNQLKEGLDLNKPLCDIGFAVDALYVMTGTEEQIGFKIKMEEQQFAWKFKFDDSNHESTLMELIEGKDQVGLENINLFSTHFQYLSAARWAPRESYPKNNYEVENKNQISIEKGQGELVAHYLDRYRRLPVSDFLLNENSKQKDLLSQTSAWEKEITSYIDVEVKPIGKSYEINYGFETPRKRYTFKAENVGFGVSYCLPMIVAILSAKPGSLIIIENPEAHLHPQGQAKLVELMAKAAQSGIQLLVETHSDHILNGVMLACKQFETQAGAQGIDKNKVKIYNFDRNNETHAAEVTEIGLREGGKIKNQPEGFFDQMEKDMESLMGF